MATSQFPAYLRLIGSRRALLAPAVEATPPLALQDADPSTGVATRQALLDRLETMGQLAPAAPLSFLVVKVAGIAHCEGDEPLRKVAGRVRELVRATDVVGRLTGTSFGIALQGIQQAQVDRVHDIRHTENPSVMLHF